MMDYGCSIKPVARDSGIELMRIVAMLLVVSSHLVSASGVSKFFDYSNPKMNMLFLQLFGLWGKTAINAFVLITGYFMCTSQLTSRRFIKIY